MVLLKTSKKILIEKEDGRHKPLKDDQSMLFGARCGFWFQNQRVRCAFHTTHKNSKKVVWFCDQSQIDARCNAFIVFPLFIFWLFTGCFFWLFRLYFSRGKNHADQRRQFY